MANNNAIVGVILVILIIIVAAALLLSSTAPPSSVTTAPPATTSAYATTTATSSQSKTNAPVMITDPAQVPAGTSALVFTYSNVQLNVSTPSGPTWVNATGSGSVNLVAIRNMSQVMAYANIAANSTVSQVRLLVNSVKITVNGTTSNVTVSNPQLTLTLTGATKVNATSGVLIDYTPTVSPSFSGNSTDYVRVPAGKAIVTGGVNATYATNVGAVASLTGNAKASLAATTPSLTITSATVGTTSSGNTTVSVTVRNNANQNVTLNNLIVYGQQKVSAQANASAGVSASFAASVSGVLGGTLGLGVLGTLTANEKAFIGVGVNIQSYAMENFALGSSGSMTVINSLASAQTSGTTIAPGGTATLTFSGQASYNSGTYVVTPKSGSVYNIVVSGKSGASATGSATAT